MSGTDWDQELNDGYLDQDSIVWIKKAKIDMMKFNMNKKQNLYVDPYGCFMILFSPLTSFYNL